MENTRSSSLLPTIKCSNCAADIQISSITDHVCSINGNLTPAEYTPISNMMPSEMSPGTAFLQIAPQTPSSISSSPASPGRLPFSNKTKYISNSLSQVLTPPESLSPNKDSISSGFPSPRDVYLRLKSIEEHKRTRSKTQARTLSNPELNQMDAAVYPKSTDNSGFFLKVDKIAPGPFDVKGKRDLLNNVEYDTYRKTSVDNLDDTRTRKASNDIADVHPLSARGHFYKNSSGSISSKTNYAILPKVPRKNGYDGFGPPNSSNNEATNLRSTSHSQKLSLNNQSSPLSSLQYNLELETKIKSFVDDVVRKDETPDFSESIFNSVSMMPRGFNGRKKDSVPPISPLNITDGLSWPTSQNNLDNLPLVLPKIKIDNLPPLPPLSPLPPKKDFKLPSSLPQKISKRSPLVVPKIKLDNLPPLPPLSPLPPKEEIKLPRLLPSKELNKPSSLSHKIKTNQLPLLPQLRTLPLKENIDERPPFPQKNPDNSPSQLQQNKLLPSPPKESSDEPSSFLAHQSHEKKLHPEDYIEVKPQFLSLERSNKIDDINEGHIFGLSNPNTSLKHNRKRSDVSQLENLMADIESSISDLDLNERPSTRSSSHSSTLSSISTTYKSINDSNNNLQNSNALSSPLVSLGVPKILNSMKNSINRPNFPRLNSFPTHSTDIVSIDRAVQPGLPSDRSPRSETCSPYDKPRFSKGKGKCRGCGEDVYGKSVSSADGRLTGRYHKECFVCKICQKPFKTASCYVINDAPYCEAHYHQINGSNCFTCKKGIEGKYIETDRGQKHHPDCLRCSDCRCVLQNNYFEINGLLYCENDAYQRTKQKHYLNSNVDGKSSQMECGPKSLVMT